MKKINFFLVGLFLVCGSDFVHAADDMAYLQRAHGKEWGEFSKRQNGQGALIPLLRSRSREEFLSAADIYAQKWGRGARSVDLSFGGKGVERGEELNPILHNQALLVACELAGFVVPAGGERTSVVCELKRKMIQNF
jgi:hypothetical protein